MASRFGLGSTICIYLLALSIILSNVVALAANWSSMGIEKFGLWTLKPCTVRFKCSTELTKFGVVNCQLPQPDDELSVGVTHANAIKVMGSEDRFQGYCGPLCSSVCDRISRRCTFRSSSALLRRRLSSASVAVVEPRSGSRATEAHLSDPDGPRYSTDAVRRDQRKARHHQQVTHCRTYLLQTYTPSKYDSIIGPVLYAIKCLQWCHIGGFPK